MARILLIGNLNCDRVWRLDRPMQPGDRIVYRMEGDRLGGAGAITGGALAYAGHDVRIAAALGDDATGDWVIAQAHDLSLDTAEIERQEGPTAPVHVMVDPAGERTILTSADRFVYRPPPDLAARPVDALYVNCHGDAVEPFLEAATAQVGLVIAQIPRRVGERRPAHVLIASQHDLAAWSIALSLEAARVIAGPALRWLVVTRGADGAEAMSADERHSAAAPPADVVDATGAGDVFAAGLIDGLVRGGTMPDALAKGVAWGAYAVTCPTSIPPPAFRDWLSTRA